MNNISINYIIENDISENRFNEIIEGCKSEDHKISLNIYDFSLSKNILGYKKHKDVNVIEQNYEDREKAQSIVLQNITSYADSTLMTILTDNIILKDLYKLNSIMPKGDDLFGFLYSDYHIDGIRCFLKSHSPHLKIGIPLSFWKTEKVLKHLSDDKNVFGVLYSNYIGLHVPESLCYFHTNNNDK